MGTARQQAEQTCSLREEESPHGLQELPCSLRGDPDGTL